MFEKEAEEIMMQKVIKKNDCIMTPCKTLEDCQLCDFCFDDMVDAFKDGAEFGYNKANEWHYVKDELPELYKDVLVVFPRGDCDVKRLTNHNEWVGRGSWCSLTDVIAWKEIVLPELKESE